MDERDGTGRGTNHGQDQQQLQAQQSPLSHPPADAHEKNLAEANSDLNNHPVPTAPDASAVALPADEANPNHWHPPPPPPPPPPPGSSSSASATPRESSHTMMDVDEPDDRGHRATSVLSMDDIEAAQALEDLRSDFANTPARSENRSTSQQQEPEPLLSLLTSTHPLISSAINGSVSAYTSSKSYSPRFKYGAEFIERNIGSPVANTVGTVSRKTGVEGGLRWALQRRAESNDGGAQRHKRRKTNDLDIEKGIPDNGSQLSSEDPPPYDDNRSPSYEEITRGQTPSTWQSRLMISTSGLGVAMSEESLRRLSYCLKWLRWANERLSKAIVALKDVLQKWEGGMDDKEKSSSNRAALSQHIQVVKEDVLRTLKQVVDIVSKYAGGALPENARNLVRRHLVSLPQRFRLASTSAPEPPSESSNASSEEAISARRVLVLAQEGLDMMVQVTRVVNDTLVSAETWCERLGRKRPGPSDNWPNDAKNGANGEPPQQQSPPPPLPSSDIKQPLVDTAPTQGDVEMTGTDVS